MPQVTRGGPTADTVIDLSGADEHVVATAWLRDGSAWAVTARLDGQLTLRRYAPGSGAVEAWLLPVKASLTPNTYLAQDAQGRIWIAANYTIAAFDPAAGKFSETFTLDSKAPDATSDALSRDAALPGTWVVGLARSTDGGVHMLRHNVLREFALGAGGVQPGAPLTEPPSGYFAGADGAVTAVAGAGGEARRSASTGTSVAGAGANRLTAGTCGAALDAGSGQISLANTGGASLVLATGLHTGGLDMAGASPNGRYAVFALHKGGEIAVVDCEARAVRRITLPMIGGDANAWAPAPRDGSVPQTPGAAPLAIESVAVSDTGAVAAGDGLMRLLIWK